MVLGRNLDRRPSPDKLGRPVSTAPARLQQEKVEAGTKRRRNVTEAYIKARYAGFPSPRYSQ
jgi:hypothetical protein